jgi:hypothetical protein
MANTTPLSIALGFENERAIYDMSNEINQIRMEAKFERPILLRSARANTVAEGFTDFAEMLISAVAHASDIRIEKGTEMAVGLVHGPVYAPSETFKNKTPLLFETVLLTVVDQHGVVAWTMPNEAFPAEATGLYEVISSAFRQLMQKRKAKAPPILAPITEGLLSSLCGHIRPLPPSFGVIRPFQ